jgi:hypothetical protein
VLYVTPATHNEDGVDMEFATMIGV